MIASLKESMKEDEEEMIIPELYRPQSVDMT